jgi:hypothetical protein
MSTASTQFEDERRLYENIRKHHREALKREQVRLARGDQPGGDSFILASARKMFADSLGFARAASIRQPQSPPAKPAEVTSSH